MKKLFFFAGFQFLVFPATAKIRGNNADIENYHSPPSYQIQDRFCSQGSIVVKTDTIVWTSNIIPDIPIVPANEEINDTHKILFEQLVNTKN